MKEYVALSKEVYQDRGVFDLLLEKSVEYVSSLPMKEKKRKTP